MEEHAVITRALAEGRLANLANEALREQRPPYLTKKLLQQLLSEAADHAEETEVYNHTTDPVAIVDLLLHDAISDPPTHWPPGFYGTEIPKPPDVIEQEAQQVEQRRENFPQVWRAFLSMVGQSGS